MSSEYACGRALEMTRRSYSRAAASLSNGRAASSRYCVSARSQGAETQSSSAQGGLET